jgi:hypothetical protein
MSIGAAILIVGLIGPLVISPGLHIFGMVLATPHVAPDL